MPLDSTRETVTAFLKDLSARGPSERHFATDVIFTATITGEIIVGRAAVAGSIRQFLHETFNARLLIKAVLLDDEKAWVEADVVGTHRRIYRGIAASGREISVPCSLAFHLRDGAIVALHGRLPVGQLLDQIGVSTPAGEHYTPGRRRVAGGRNEFEPGATWGAALPCLGVPPRIAADQPDLRRSQ